MPLKLPVSVFQKTSSTKSTQPHLRAIKFSKQVQKNKEAMKRKQDPPPINNYTSRSMQENTIETEIVKGTNLMNWWIHWICTDRALQQLVDTGCGSNGRRTHNIVVIGASITRLGWRKLRMKMSVRMQTMVLDLILIQAIWGRNTLDAVQVHHSPKNPSKWSKIRKKETPSNRNHKISPKFIWAFPSQNLLPSILFVLTFFVWFSRKFTRGENKIGEGRWGFSWIGEADERVDSDRANYFLWKNRFLSWLALSLSLQKREEW